MLIPLSLRLRFRGMLEPLARALSSSRVSPNAITIIGFIPAVIGGFVFAKGMIRLGGIFVGVSGLFDLMDGLVAKLANKQTKFGALLDSTLDRYGEIAVLIGLAIHFRDGTTLYGVLLALCGSLMVSYVKARAEGLGFSCESGLLQRPERIVIVLVGALLGPYFIRWAIWIIAVLGNATAIERLIRVKALMGEPKP